MTRRLAIIAVVFVALTAGCNEKEQRIGDVNAVKKSAEQLAEEEIVQKATSLFLAADEGNSDEVKRLLAEGADITSIDEKGRTALHAAVLGGNTDIVAMLVKAGADIEAEDENRATPLFLAVTKTGDYEMVKKLLELGTDVNGTTRVNNVTPLFWAVGGGDKELVELLLDRGAEEKLVRDKRYGKLVFRFSRGDEVRKLIAEKIGVKPEAVVEIEKSRRIGGIDKCVEACGYQQKEVYKRTRGKKRACRKKCYDDWDHFAKTGKVRGCVDYCKKDWRPEKIY